ncbi:MAG TPA: hypothetical protein PLC26_04660, partial [Bacillota bacterium]|nr:hypothetical protein [Bacillota bacterium]
DNSPRNIKRMNETMAYYKPEAWRCTCNEPATSSLSILIPIRKQFSLCFLKKKEIDPGKRNKIIGLTLG